MAGMRLALDGPRCGQFARFWKQTAVAAWYRHTAQAPHLVRGFLSIHRTPPLLDNHGSPPDVEARVVARNRLSHGYVSTSFAGRG
jgi:hypothetical protein